nr:hypothetical protein [uncultured Mucilaginibacter sp.]
MKYSVVLIIVFAIFASACEHKKDAEYYYSLKTAYDVVSADSVHADIYLKQKLPLGKLNAIADSCFGKHGENISKEFRVSFSYWNDGKFREVAAEKIWMHDFANHRFKEFKIREIVMHGDMP